MREKGREKREREKERKREREKENILRVGGLRGERRERKKNGCIFPMEKWIIIKNLVFLF